MRTTLRNLVLAATSALTLAVPRARACEPAAPPARVFPQPQRIDYRYFPEQVGRRDSDDRGWREGGWRRDCDPRDLRGDFRRLERDRDRFYQRWGWNHEARERFEARYAARRADLEARWQSCRG